ncbi:hypothetical protein MKC73_01020 [[Clostridium] innocuum]|nr:hypothetical protein [[Clostridium] innocuum]
MTNREINLSIKKELQEHGISPRKVSVKISDHGFSSSIHVKIKDPHINRSEVRAILLHHQEYERDEHTGEILEGGNTFLFVEYQEGIFEEAAEQWAATARGVWMSKEETTRIFNGLFLIDHEHSGALEIRQQDEKENCTYKVHSFSQLCEFLYKFSEFGTIAV